MDKNELQKRTKRFALEVIQFVLSLRKGILTDVIGKQLIRCATSIGANYRSACRARSYADFIAKIAIVTEEADEAIYWLELIEESGLSDNTAMRPFITEADELTAIFTSIGKTAKLNKSKILHPKS